jgi:CHAT domain-containing protein
MEENILGPAEFFQIFMNNATKYSPTGTPRDQVFWQILGAVQFMAPNLIRDLTATYHPLSPGGSLHQPTADPAAAIADFVKKLNVVKLQGIADANGATGIASYLARLVVEFHLACQRPSAYVELEGLYSRYEAHADVVGIANCKMIEGDSLVSPPFASPLSLNMVIIDASTAIAEDTLWDPTETDLTFTYSSKAQECYISALDLFQEANCKRGQAAVLLRQGCCLHTVVRHQKKNKGMTSDALDEAETKLQMALELFGKDEANVQLVKTHQILLQISKGNTRHSKKIAREIGQWSIHAKNERFGHYLGLLLSRYARQEWFQFSRMGTALAAWDCAYELCDALGDVVPKFQTVVSRAWVQSEMSNTTAARLFLDEALAMVDQVSDYYETRIQRAPDDPIGKLDLKSLRTAKFNVLWTFSQKVNSIYLRVEDLSAFEKWQKKLAYWIQYDDSFRGFRDGLQNDVDYGTTRRDVLYVPRQMKSLWEKTMAGDEVRVRYAAAEISYRRVLEEGDVIQAEEILRSFVDQAMSLNQVYTRDLWCILACERIGDLAKAREILDGIDDNDLFNGCLEDFQQGIATRSIFPTIAENALMFSVYAGDYARGQRMADLILEISPKFFDELNENSLNGSFRLCHYSTILMHTFHPERAFSRFLQARRAIELSRTQITDVDARIGSSWAGWTREVLLNLAVICLRCRSAGVPVAVMARYDHGHPDDISWEEHALLFTEGSRARAVLESLQGQADQGKLTDSRTVALSEAVYKRRTLRTLLALESRSPEQENEILQLEQDIKLLEDADELSPATAFIETVNSTVDPQLLYQCIDEDAVVIEVTFGPRGSIAFALTREGIQQIHYGPTRTVDMRRPVMQIMQIMKEMTGYHGEEEGTRKKHLTSLSQAISAELLDPFTQTISTKKHIIFSISDPLTAFPFSTLQFKNKPLIHHAAVSQVPSLTVLYHLSQRKHHHNSTPTVSVFAKSPTEEPPSQTRANKESNLHMAGIEAINIARTFQTWPIEASTLTRQSFRQHVEGESPILHIGTHGDLNHRNPLLSSISIGHGQDFRVLDMSAVRSNVSLLVFAACLSGLGKATISSEVLGFSHVVLSTGCQAYIGTLWKVSDFGSMMVMTIFYRLLKRKTFLSVAEVMREAQLEVLGLDCEKAGALLDDIMGDWSSPDTLGRVPAEFVPDAEFLMLTLKMILEQLDWSSPFYWAPFTLMGYGDFRFLGV